MGKKYRPMFVKKKSHKVRNAFIILLVLLALLMCFVAYAEVFAGFRDDDTAVSVYFPENASENEIVTILADSGVIKYPKVFKICSFFGGNTYIGGSHILTKSRTYPEIFSTIKVKNDSNVVTIVINSGATIDDIALIAADEFEIPKEDFLSAAASSDYAVETSRTDKKLEGYFCPGIYRFAKDADMTEVVGTILKEFDNNFNEQKKQRAAQIGCTVDQVVTIASLAQKQGQSADEVKAAAKQILQSFKNGELLENEDALKYSLNKKELSDTDKKIDTPYNTFIHTGLPKGAICSPSVAAIDAVLE